MKPRLKAQDCTDHDPIESWAPGDPAAIDYWLCLHIGPDDAEGSDLFQVNVLSAAAAARLSPEELGRRKKIIIRDYSWSAVIRAMQEILQPVEGPDWPSIAEQLSKRFDWEFHDYQPLQAGS